MSCVPKKRMVFCANCGGLGHIYKTCNHPVISYGIICYKPSYDDKCNSVSPSYLMVQRKDSLCYVEFIRGKYDLSNREYVLKLFSHMTNEERENIRNNDFETLWNSMWCKDQCNDQCNNTRNFNRECLEATEKFNMLSRGYMIVKQETNDHIFFNLTHILDNTTSLYDETEWGFPKGRRNINEDDINCAVREFREETGIATRNIRINWDIKPLEEVFTGSNKIRYKHVYYIARFVPPKFDCEDELTYQRHNKEVKDVQWFNYQDAQDRIRGYNVERKELFKRLNQIIMKSYHCGM